MVENGIQQIDLVVMNLYPFEATVGSGAEFNQCIENIDIGGPSMLRSSAKNHSYVAIVTSPSQYDELLAQLRENNCSTSLNFRKKLAANAFRVSAAYDTAIATYFAQQLQDDKETTAVVNVVTAAPATLHFSYKHAFNLKYGCNPHQKPAGIYTSLALTQQQQPFRVVGGTPGYINLLDACNAWQLVKEAQQALQLPAAASFKHCSPAGVDPSPLLVSSRLSLIISRSCCWDPPHSY
jgi:phosphoribosylaminoimidazolecarboxamide formyltransferase / IMP cyclohydrolase